MRRGDCLVLTFALSVSHMGVVYNWDAEFLQELKEDNIYYYWEALEGYNGTIVKFSTTTSDTTAADDYDYEMYPGNKHYDEATEETTSTTTEPDYEFDQDGGVKLGCLTDFDCLAGEVCPHYNGICRPIMQQTTPRSEEAKLKQFCRYLSRCSSNVETCSRVTDCSLGGGHLAPCASHADCADGLYCELHHEHKEGDDPGACKTKALPGQFCQHTAECEASLCGIRHNGHGICIEPSGDYGAECNDEFPCLAEFACEHLGAKQAWRGRFCLDPN